MTGQILLMSKEALARRVLANPDIDLYPCGRDDIRSGQVDRRVLATLEFLAASGLRPTVTSLKCGHSYYTAVGQRLRPLVRATRSTSRRSTAPRSSATRARARSPSSRSGGCSRSRARCSPTRSSR